MPTQPAGAASQPAAAPQYAPQPASVPPPQPQPKPISTKTLVVIGGIVLVLGLAAYGVMFYGVHWFKGKVSGVSIGNSGSVHVADGHACDLLSTAELQQVLGVTVERSSEITENNNPGCAYFTNPAAFADLQKMAIEQAKRDSEKASQDPAVKDSKSDNPLSLLGHTEEMEGMVKGLGMSQPDPEGKVFSFTIERNFRRSSWVPLRATLSIVPGFKQVEGVGDDAMIGSFGHALYILKGDTMVHLDTNYVPEARVRGAEIGRKLISHY
ncbi:MAG TPA: hypothetical protein VFR84_17060 [Candidatus Angelobacter sp.]|nr:hypothetical protein [Candidatus Angelobacter sp.]